MLVMLLVKFTKRYPASFMSHLDVLRSFLRAFTRAGIKVKQSQGFNPHYIVYFTSPLPSAVESEAEYTCIDTDINPVDFSRLMQGQTLKGIEIVSVKQLNYNPNVAGIVTYSDYRVKVDLTDEQKSILKSVLDRDSLVISYTQKGKLVQKEVRSLIADISVDDGIMLRLASGNSNLRVDRLLDGVDGLNLKYAPYDVVRLEQYTGEINSLIPLSELTNK